MVPTGTPSRNITGGRASRLPPRLACASALRALQAAQEAARGAAAGARSRSSAPTSQPASQPSGATAPPAAAGRPGGAAAPAGPSASAGMPGHSGGGAQAAAGSSAAGGPPRQARRGAAGQPVSGAAFRWVSLACAFLQCARGNTLVTCSGLVNHDTGQGRVRGCNRDCPGGGRCARACSCWGMRGGQQAALPPPLTTLLVQ